MRKSKKSGLTTVEKSVTLGCHVVCARCYNRKKQTCIHCNGTGFINEIDDKYIEMIAILAEIRASLSEPELG